MAAIDPIQQEILRLSLRVAVARLELKEAILAGVPISLCGHICQEISICLLQRSALQDGRFKELPYPIRLLYAV